MRVITGSARGRKLESPRGTDTRPTSEMVKEAVMSMIQFEIEGCSFLDLYAGCGQMGIEALSRGAHKCTFVDSSREACVLIRRNLEHTGFLPPSLVAQSDVQTWLRTARGPFDIAFIDPPYNQAVTAGFLERLAELMRDSGIILIECDNREDMPSTAGKLSLIREYKYGKTKIVRYEVQQL
ncbi:MAG: 16S rRNA (guanine(966)-N(2))-methyltransferase RsmD [Oscillospiraceae bacterium]|nr:16S rRNA (guanine(966)-N(2))-methyltransferase RsmD [Oscillospiraceae bacterium]